VLAIVALGCFAGCGSAEPPPPKPPATIAKKKPPPPPEPEPECISLAEKCVADGSTKATIPGTSLAFVPPSSWLFAQEAEVTLAQTPDGGPCLAMASFESSGDAKVETGREAAMDVMLRSLGLALPKPKSKRTKKPLIDWAKPMSTNEVGKIELDFWQLEGGDRASVKGSVLVARFKSAGRTVLITGFAPSNDSSDADKAILDALKTIGPADEKEDEAGDTEGEGEVKDKGS